MNKVIIMGNLGRDPETRYMPSGAAATTINVATSRGWTDKNSGEKQEETSWHRCVAFGKTAEVIAEHFTKGRKILIEGRLKYGQYEKDGITRYTCDIVIERFEFVEKRGDQRPIPSDDTHAGAPAAPASQEQASDPGGEQAPPHTEDDRPPPEFDDDIPF